MKIDRNFPEKGQIVAGKEVCRFLSETAAGASGDGLRQPPELLAKGRPNALNSNKSDL